MPEVIDTPVAAPQAGVPTQAFGAHAPLHLRLAALINKCGIRYATTFGRKQQGEIRYRLGK